MIASLCFSCVLPDCNEASPRCALRRASNRLRADQIAGRITRDIDRIGDAEWRTACNVDRQARRSEGVAS